MTTTLIGQQTIEVKPDIKHRIPQGVDEIVALCPRCKAFETLFFAEEGLLPTRKFVQDDGHIYHNCGSDKPCRLYRVC